MRWCSQSLFAAVLHVCGPAAVARGDSQVLLALPPALQMILTNAGTVRLPRWHDVADPLFWVALFVLVIAPAAVGGMSIVILRRSRRRDVTRNRSNLSSLDRTCNEQERRTFDERR